MELFLSYEEEHNIIKQILLESYTSQCWERPTQPQWWEQCFNIKDLGTFKKQNDNKFITVFQLSQASFHLSWNWKSVFYQVIVTLITVTWPHLRTLAPQQDKHRRDACAGILPGWGWHVKCEIPTNGCQRFETTGFLCWYWNSTRKQPSVIRIKISRKWMLSFQCSGMYVMFNFPSCTLPQKRCYLK